MSHAWTLPPGIDIRNPLHFVRLCWPDMKLYSKQRDVLLSVVQDKETYVHAANELGKSRIAAVASIFFFASRTPARVITSSTTQAQLETILWTEIRNLIATSAYPLPFDVSHLRVRKFTDLTRSSYCDLDYIVGHVTNAVESFQGHHLPNDKPRVLCVFDEASGISDEFKDAADSWAHRTLVIGNPLSTTNFFFRDCKRGPQPDPSGMDRLLRNVIHIDGLDSPNVKIGMHRASQCIPGPHPLLIPGLLSYDEYLVRDQEWDEVKKTMRLRGRFYEGEQTMLFPVEWLDLSQSRYRELAGQKEPRRAEAMGVDVAGGRDLSAWTVVDRHGVLHMHCEATPDTTRIVDITIRLLQDFSLSPLNAIFDAGGGGKQIVDRLRQLGYRVRAVAFGGSTSEAKTKAKSKLRDQKEVRLAYKNRRAEMYGNLRKIVNPHDNVVFALPDRGQDAELLREELSILPLQYNEEGKMYLPPKDLPRSEPGKGRRTQATTLRAMLGRSPDRADALVLAVDGMLHKKNLSIGADTEEGSRARANEAHAMQQRIAEKMAKMQQAWGR